MCSDIEDPVCGCDGKTYENACRAAVAGWGYLHKGECESLEIVGTYTTEWGQTVVITNTEWAEQLDTSSFSYVISQYNNEEGYIIAQSSEDETWSRFEWTVSSDTLYYCQVVFGEATETDAESDENVADADDLDEGCGGFSWTELTVNGLLQKLACRRRKS
jgi:hypothetical protein